MRGWNRTARKVWKRKTRQRRGWQLHTHKGGQSQALGSLTCNPEMPDAEGVVLAPAPSTTMLAQSVQPRSTHAGCLAAQAGQWGGRAIALARKYWMVRALVCGHGQEQTSGTLGLSGPREGKVS